MTAYDVVRNAIPDATDDLCEFIIWARTGYPSFWKTDNPVKEIYQAANRWARAKQNGRRLCEYCDTGTNLGMEFSVVVGDDICERCRAAQTRAREMREKV